MTAHALPAVQNGVPVFIQHDGLMSSVRAGNHAAFRTWLRDKCSAEALLHTYFWNTTRSDKPEPNRYPNGKRVRILRPETTPGRSVLRLSNHIPAFAVPNP